MFEKEGEFPLFYVFNFLTKAETLLKKKKEKENELYSNIALQ